MSNEDVCGAQTNKGTPCQRPAGWGTDKSEGKCRFHLDSRNQEIKKRFIQLLKQGSKTMAGCAKTIGKDPSTIWLWRQKDEEFDEKVEQARSIRDKKMAADVEDKMYSMIMQGEASATDRIFFLKNRAPGRWKDKKEFEHSGDDVAQIVVSHDLVEQKEEKEG